MNNALLIAAMVGGLLMPPAQFDREPRAPYKVNYVSTGVVEAKCGKNRDTGLFEFKKKYLGAHKNQKIVTLGCTHIKARPMQVWIDKTLRSR